MEFLDKVVLDPSTVYHDIQDYPRSVAWQRAAQRYLLPPEVQWLLRKHVRDLRLFEKATRRLRAHQSPTKTAPARGIAAPPVKSRPGGSQGPYARHPQAPPARFRRRAGARPGFVRETVVMLAHKSWERFPPGSPARRARMLPAWRAARRKKDELLLASVHPHVLKLVGRREALRRLGRVVE